MVNLEWIHQQLVMEIQEGLAAVASGAAPISIGATFEQLSQYLQALGICHLLKFADREEYRTNLVRSAHCRLYYLQKSSSREPDKDHRIAISRTEAFFDALAAGDLIAARDIAANSKTEWVSDGEYEDDFCYYSFLHGFLQNPDEKTNASLTLHRFEESLQGADSERLELCRAILERDQGRFAESFDAFLTGVGDTNAKKRETVEDYELAFWPRSFISIEGYALLRVAELAGIGLDGPFVLCPDLGRLPIRNELTNNLFEEIDRHLGTVGTQ